MFAPSLASTLLGEGAARLRPGRFLFGCPRLWPPARALTLSFLLCSGLTMMHRTVIVEVERRRTLPNAGSETLFFVCHFGNRGRRPVFFQPDVVPEFEGEIATVELDVSRRPWRILRVLSTQGPGVKGSSR